VASGRFIPTNTKIVAAIAMAVGMLAAGCGTADAPTTGSSLLQPQPSEGDGLALRIVGRVEGELLCPGRRRPCLPFDGQIEPETDAAVWVAGRLANGVSVVDAQHSLPQHATRDYANQCSEQEIDGPPPMAVREAMHKNTSERPTDYVDLWDSDDGVLHLGVTDDSSPAAAFLDERGISDQVCLVTGFPYPDEVLEKVQQAVVDAASNRGYDDFGVSRDSWEGTVTIDLPLFDQEFRAQLDQISEANSGVPIAASAGVEVINGSLGDYETALASIAVAPDASHTLTAGCGPVTFSSVPPDLDEFPS
jgi:hypothetical protein